MSIEINPVNSTVRIDDYVDAVMFLSDNNWDLNVIPEEKQKEILSLANKDGQTIVHAMAGRGHKFKDSEILKLTDNNGDTVKAIMNIQSDEMKENLEILNSLSEQRPENV